MGKILYGIAILLIAGWLVGWIGFHLGSAIHVLLITGLVIIILQFFAEKKSV